VDCVACHVGPGASGLVEAKLAGVRRVVATLTNSHARPIPPPTHDALPARDTCEHCHWAETRRGEVIKRIQEFGNDESSSETITTLRLKVGGGSGESGSGIHWHMSVGHTVDFVAADDRRHVIDFVRLTDRQGTVREYVRPGTTVEQYQPQPMRRMDCMDCHNRPAHPNAPSAARAVDQALAAGTVPRALPFMRREAIKALEAGYTSEDEAMAGIAAALGTHYRPPQAGRVGTPSDETERAIRAVQAIYRRNVFPDMRVTFGTYPSHLGHVDTPGCFRCHDDALASQDGRTIGQDCETCHTIE
jgi:hypothetical protein